MPNDVGSVRRNHLESWMKNLLSKRRASTAATYYNG
jgi:hypothetical protein